MIRGRVWKFGDNVNTDNIIPGRYKFKTQNLEELVKYVLIDLNPEFPEKVGKGDIIVLEETSAVVQVGSMLPAS